MSIAGNEMFNLFHDGFDTAEIAEILNLPESVVWNERRSSAAASKTPAMKVAIAALALSCVALAVSALSAASAEPWPICSGGNRAARGVTCVVDGDTIWFRGEKIRIANIDAPELRGKCRAERRLARVARDRLRLILENFDIDIRRTGKDRYGRTLATIRAGRIDVGDALIAGGHAAPWRGRQADWCD